MGVVVDGEVRFGKMINEGLQEYVPTTKGHMRKGEKVWTVDKLPWYELRPEQIMETVEWGGRPVGIAEDLFPDPQGWRLRGVDVGLDRIRVKLLTSAMAGMTHVQPACIEAWRSRIGELPNDIGARYNNSLLTPRDWTSHFKNVLHRAMLTRSVTTQSPCRCCGYARENLQHFADCPGWGGFEEMRKLSQNDLHR